MSSGLRRAEVVGQGGVHLAGDVAYEELRREQDLPFHEEDRDAQLDTIAAVAADVVAWIYDQY